MTISVIKFYPITPMFRDQVESIPLKEIAYQSGHSGHGYKAGWIQGLYMTRLYSTQGVAVTHDELSQWDIVADAVDELGRFLGDDWGLAQVLVNRLDGHSKLDMHRDGHSTDYRFHLPVITNPDVIWWDQLNSDQHLSAVGWWGPVPYSGVLHAMRNDANMPRYHIVADFSPPK